MSTNHENFTFPERTKRSKSKLECLYEIVLINGFIFFPKTNEGLKVMAGNLSILKPKSNVKVE